MRCRYTTMKLISTILLASTAAALKQRAAPMKALQVPRGGGMVEKSQALTVTKVVFGLYGAQMLLVPDFVMTQNFKSRRRCGYQPVSEVA